MNVEIILSLEKWRTSVRVDFFELDLIADLQFWEQHFWTNCLIHFLIKSETQKQESIGSPYNLLHVHELTIKIHLWFFFTMGFM